MPEGQCPFMCSQTRCVRLGLQRPMSFIQQGQKIDKDEIKYHDIFSMFLVKQKIKQAQFYCQNVNLCTALGKADSGTYRRSGFILKILIFHKTIDIKYCQFSKLSLLFLDLCLFSFHLLNWLSRVECCFLLCWIFKTHFCHIRLCNS